MAATEAGRRVNVRAEEQKTTRSARRLWPRDHTAPADRKASDLSVYSRLARPVPDRLPICRLGHIQPGRDLSKGSFVGASGWDYRTPYAGSVEATLIALQGQVLASGEYIWPWDRDYRNPAFLAHMERFARETGWQAGQPAGTVPRPSSVAGLDVVKQAEEFWDEGTHSILDVDHVIAAEEDDELGAILPLTPRSEERRVGKEC